jgi:desulfoferrodoxin (superoxide reductase-like protein)
MILDYDRGEKQLSVEITHPSNDINEHYIRKVTIKNNSQIVKEHYSFRQAHPHKFTLKFPLIAEAGDVIEVKVYCSEGGSRTAKLIIEEIE